MYFWQNDFERDAINVKVNVERDDPGQMLSHVIVETEKWRAG
jgi:hypothetical protein